MLLVNEKKQEERRKKKIVIIKVCWPHILATTEPLNTRSGLDPVPRCEPSTYHPYC